MLDIVNQGTQNAKLHADLDSSYQKSLKKHTVQHSVTVISKLVFQDVVWWPSWIYAKFQELPELAFLATKLDKF